MDERTLKSFKHTREGPAEVRRGSTKYAQTGLMIVREEARIEDFSHRKVEAAKQGNTTGGFGPRCYFGGDMAKTKEVTLACAEKIGKRACGEEATWIWEEYDEKLPLCEEHAFMELETLVKDRSTASIETECPDRGRPGTIKVD